MCFYCYICVTYQCRKRMCYEYFQKLLLEHLHKPRFEFPNLNLVALGTLNLQRLAKIRIAIQIWSQHKWNKVLIKILTKHGRSNNIIELEQEWMKVTEQAFCDIRWLKLPAEMRNHLEFIVEMVGHELLLFLKYYKEYYSCASNINEHILIEDIVWTSFGTIDKVKTHRNFSSKRALIHLKLACPVCVDSAIMSLWKCVMQNRKLSTLSMLYFAYHKLTKPLQIVVLWGNVFKNAIRRLQLARERLSMLSQVNSVEEKMALLSAHDGNIECFIFFWEKMYQDERNNLLPLLMEVFNEESVRAIRYPFYSEIVLFLMNEVNEANRQDLVRHCSFILINGLLEKWPFYGVIVNQFDRIIPHLTTVEYKKIVVEILLKMHNIEKTRIKHKFYRNEFRCLWSNMEYYVARAPDELADFIHETADN